MSRKTRSEGVMNSFYSTFLEKRQDFNYLKTANSSIEIKERLLSLGLENVKIQTYDNNDDLNSDEMLINPFNLNGFNGGRN